jgi:succinylglutamate desuccinylase
VSGGPHAPSARFDRILGRYDTGRAGPALLVVGGLHGNEPAGVLAALRVCERLERERPTMRGSLVAVAGHREALDQNERYLQLDLNRLWVRKTIRALRAGGPALDTPERREQRALLRIIEEAKTRARDRFVVLDLHTTSGDSPPFTVMSDTLRNRRLALGLPLPVILGLEESVDGTMLDYLTEQGHDAIVVEGGQHDDPGSVDRHEATIWLMLLSAGLLRRHELPDLDRWRALLQEASAGLPRVCELRYRHAIPTGAGFEMTGGHRGFERIRAGEVLARDTGGDVRAPESGYLLMPLYQRQGNDGFFLVCEVSRLWLVISALLRSLGLRVLLPLLPGVRRHHHQLRALRVDVKRADSRLVGLMHLFGYRRRRADGEHIIFSRRRPG